MLWLFLDAMVAKLKRGDIENASYQDIDWKIFGRLVPMRYDALQKSKGNGLSKQGTAVPTRANEGGKLCAYRPHLACWWNIPKPL